MTDRELALKTWSEITDIFLVMPPGDPKLSEVREIYLKYDRELRNRGILPAASGSPR